MCAGKTCCCICVCRVGMESSSCVSYSFVHNYYRGMLSRLQERANTFIPSLALSLCLSLSLSLPLCVCVCVRACVGASLSLSLSLSLSHLGGPAQKRYHSLYQCKAQHLFRHPLVYIHTYTSFCLHMRMLACTHTHTHTHEDAHTHTHTHTHTHVHTQCKTVLQV